MSSRAERWGLQLLPEELEIYERLGLGRRYGLGSAPAVIVIDFQIRVMGDTAGDIISAMERWPLSCGEAARRAVEKTGLLLEEARLRSIPIIFTAVDRKPEDRAHLPPSKFPVVKDGEEIVPALRRRPDEPILPKRRPSAFFGTPLISILMQRRVDTAVVVGGTTSSCVRATAVDSFQYGFATAVVEDCVFDRFPTLHKFALFDIDTKYADVLSLSETLDYFARVK